MFYFVCEGQKDKSEYSFILRLTELYNTSNLPFDLLSADGNVNIKDLLYNLIPKCMAGDTIILFFDNIEEINGVPTYDLLNSCINLCIQRGINFRYTVYYCFEELFLTYDKLLFLIKDVRHNQLVAKISDCIMNGINYLDCLDVSEINELSKLLSLDVYKCTRETLSASLLGLVTNRINGRFHISKSHIQDCWLQDCESLDIPYKCDKCEYTIKFVLDKITDLDSNSISKFSCPFSTMFN